MHVSWGLQPTQFYQRLRDAMLKSLLVWAMSLCCFWISQVLQFLFRSLFESISNSVLKMNLETKHLFSQLRLYHWKMWKHQLESIHVQMQKPFQATTFSSSVTTFKTEGNSKMCSHVQEDQYFPLQKKFSHPRRLLFRKYLKKNKYNRLCVFSRVLLLLLLLFTK